MGVPVVCGPARWVGVPVVCGPARWVGRLVACLLAAVVGCRARKETLEAELQDRRGLLYIESPLYYRPAERDDCRDLETEES